MNEKDARLAEFCSQGGWDGVVIRRRSNIAWVTDGVDVHCDLFTSLGVAAALWTPGRKAILTDNIEAARLAEEEFGAGSGREDWEIVTRQWWEGERGIGLVHGETASGRSPMPPYATDYPDDLLTDLRASLTEAERGRVRTLGADAARIMGVAVRDIRKGDSELQVAADLTGRLRREGIFARVMLVAADERIAKYRHPIPSAKHVEQIVMVAICAERGGLIVSITRLVSFGPLPEELRRRHDAVCTVDAALHRATVVGARWCDVFAEAQRVYAEVGFEDEWRKHHQGGPMGYECRDFKATPTETRRVMEGQLVGWNPSVTGTKSEDTILTGAGGAVVVTGMADWPVNPRVPGGRPDVLTR
jgi:Xaa-Pro aminopeptidase